MHITDMAYMLMQIQRIQITEAGPSAFATIKQNYYYVFVGCTVFFLVCAYFWFLETRNKTLEEIGATFGDKVVTLTENEMAAEHAVFEEKVKTEHIDQD